MKTNEMKEIGRTVGFVLLVMAPAFANARLIGGVSDGGGNAVVCRDSAHQITSAEMLDLYEARNLDGYEIQAEDPAKPYFEIAMAAAKRIDEGGDGASVSGISTSTINGVVVERSVHVCPQAGKDWLQSDLQHLDSKINFLQPGAGLSPVLDSNSRLTAPYGCAIEQVAVYNDNRERLFVVSDIWNKFDNVNKAALLVHENLYRSLRIAGDQDSLRARAAVGAGFAAQKFSWVLEGVPREFLACWTDEEISNRFVVYPDENGNAVMQFVYIDGQVPLSKVTSVLSYEDSPLTEKRSGNRVLAKSIRGSLFQDGMTLVWENKGDQMAMQFAAGGAIDSKNSKTVVCAKRGFERRDDGATCW